MNHERVNLLFTRVVAVSGRVVGSGQWAVSTI